MVKDAVFLLLACFPLFSLNFYSGGILARRTLERVKLFVSGGWEGLRAPLCEVRLVMVGRYGGGMLICTLGFSD